jgi:hypothetical protein
VIGDWYANAFRHDGEIAIGLQTSLVQAKRGAALECSGE